MMRMLGVMKYHWRRRWPLIVIYVSVLALITMTVLLFVIPRTRQFVMQIDAQGYVAQQQSFDALTLTSNPNAASDFASYSFLMLLLAFLTIGKSRKFLVSLSITRYEILLGSFAFLLSASLGLSVIGNWLVPVLTRLMTMMLGIPIQGSWSLGMVLTGNDPMFVANLVSGVCNLAFIGAAWAFIGYVMMRWWKPILILFVAGIVGLITAVQLVQWHSYVKDLAERAIEFIRWLADKAIPAIQAYFDESNSYVWSLRYLLGSVVLTALSYPIMRGRKVT